MGTRRSLATACLLCAAGCQLEFASREQAPDASPPAAERDAGSEPPDAGPPECAACDDGDPCNGKERCVRGQCEPGQPPCLSSEHCDVTCESHAGTASCVALARDADGDGHGDAACTESTARGDDCDDRHASVHVGAEELCDGLDNDCDGRLDMEDGLPAIRPPRYSLASGRAAHAAFTGAVYGLTYVHDGQVLLAVIDLAGSALFENIVVHQLAAADDAHTLLAAAADRERIAVAWSTPTELGMRFMGPDGVPDGAAIDLRGAGQSGLGALRLLRAQAPQGDAAWLAAYRCCGDDGGLFARSVSALGKLSKLVQPLEELPVRGFTLSAQSEQVLVTQLVDQGAQGMRLLTDRRDGAWAVREPGESELATGPLYDPVMASSGSTWAVAWGAHTDAGEALHYAELDAEGGVLCRTDLAEHYLPGALPMRPLDMAYFGGAFVLVGAEQGTLSTTLMQVRPGCRYAQRFRPYQDSLVRGNSFGQTLASAGDKGGLLLWHTDGFSSVSLARLGPNLCD
jgi:hypothetical protein